MMGTQDPARGFLPSVGGLWRLMRHAGEAPMRSLHLAIVFSTLAAAGEVASLALLSKGVHALAGGGGSAAARGLAMFLLAALFAAILRLVAQRRTVAAQFAVIQGLCLRAFRALQMQPYADYVRKGASSGFASFEHLALISHQAIVPLIGGIGAFLGVALVGIAFAVLYPLAALPLAVLFVALLAESAWRERRLPANALSSVSRNRAVLLHEARTAFRDIFLTNGQHRMAADFAALEQRFRIDQARAITSAQSSRHQVEIAGLGLALVLVLVMAQLPGEGRQLVPLLAVTGLAALRILPQVAALRSALRLVALHGTVTQDVLGLLESATPEPAAPEASGRDVLLGAALVLEGIEVRREGREPVLAGIDLTVPKGARIGIRGHSGAGKSTLLDVICGATVPDGGRVLVDGQVLAPEDGPAWRERIGVVSQNPILLGTTLREAVVFPQRPEEADAARFDDAVRRAGVLRMVERFAAGLDTPIGEAVSFLSGGERQRLALAHALYRARDLLILDEATGQLDAASEAAILATLQDLPPGLALIVVSHREEVFACCERVLELSGGVLR